MPKDVQKDLLVKFDKLTSHRERIDFILDNKQFTAVFDMLLKEVNSGQSGKKSAELAKQVREEGNKFFRDKLYQEALEKYSQAIELAPGQETEELALGYANRSAAFFHLNQITDCLKDIDEALRLNYPLERCYIIFGRRILCLKAINRPLEAKTEAVSVLSLIETKIADEKSKDLMTKYINQSLEKKVNLISEPSKSKRQLKLELNRRNESLPSMSSSLKVNSSKGKGRFVLASEHIDASSVLFQERAFASWLKPQLHSEFCYNCFQNIRNQHFISCKNCSMARYCSKQCQDESWTKYHSAECHAMAGLQILSVGHLALRMILVTGVQKAIEQASKSSDSIQPGAYKDVLGLVENASKYAPDKLCSLAAGSVFTALLVKDSIDKLVPTPAEKHELFLNFCGLILKHVLQVNCNSVGVQFDDTETEVGHQTLGSAVRVIGMAVYPTVSLLNHSCDKKVYVLFNKNTISVKASNGFRAGDEVTLCYGPYCRKMSVKDRKDALATSYFFNCDCTACTQKIENIGAAFSCPHCKIGPLVANYSDGSNYCVNCTKSAPSLGMYLQKLDEIKQMLPDIWRFVEKGQLLEAEGRLQNILLNYGQFFYSKSDLIAEVKEKLAYIFEEQKQLKAAMKCWLDCFYSTRELDGEDTYEALFYLLKITSALIEEADTFLDRRDKVRSNLDKARKYFSRAMSISKKLEGKECRVLEARSDLLEQMPEPTTVAKDLATLERYCQMFDKC